VRARVGPGLGDPELIAVKIRAPSSPFWRSGARWNQVAEVNVGRPCQT
jgi:hypothetical protein